MQAPALAGCELRVQSAACDDNGAMSLEHPAKGGLLRTLSFSLGVLRKQRSNMDIAMDAAAQRVGSECKPLSRALTAGNVLRASDGARLVSQLPSCDITNAPTSDNDTYTAHVTPAERGVLGILTANVTSVDASGYHSGDVLLVREVMPALPLWSSDHSLEPGDVLLEADGQTLTCCSDGQALSHLRRAALAASRDGRPVTLRLRRAPPAVRGITLFRPIFPLRAGRSLRRATLGHAIAHPLSP